MLTRLVTSCRNVVRHSIIIRRNLGVSAACYQKAAGLDPIQQLFLENIREYAKKSKGAGGALVDATSEDQKTYTDEMDRIARVYGATGPDFNEFPTLKFSDLAIDLQSVSVDAGSVKEVAVVEEAAVEEEPRGKYDYDDKPYFEINM